MFDPDQQFLFGRAALRRTPTLLGGGNPVKSA